MYEYEYGDVIGTTITGILIHRTVHNDSMFLEFFVYKFIKRLRVNLENRRKLFSINETQKTKKKIL